MKPYYSEFLIVPERLAEDYQKIEARITRAGIGAALDGDLPLTPDQRRRLLAEVRDSAPAPETEPDGFMTDPYDFSPGDQAWAGGGVRGARGGADDYLG